MKIKVQGLVAIGLIMLIGAATQIDAQIRQRGTNTQIRTLLSRIETKTDAFKRSADRSLDRGRINNTNREDEISRYIADFETATDALKRGFNSRANVSSETTEVLNRATVIDAFVRRNRLSTTTERQWNSLRTDLNTLARYYNTAWNWNQPVPATNASIPVYAVSDRQLAALFTRIETKTDVFKRQLNSSLDRSRWNNTDREDNVQNYVTAFENSTDRLKQRFDARESVGSDVSAVLTQAAYIDRFMLRNRMSRQAETQWTSLRSDLNTLATYYNVSWNWNQTLPPFTAGNTTTPVYTVSDRQLAALFTRIEAKTDTFKRQLNSSLDRSRWNNTDREDNVQNYVTAFENSTDRLKQRFDARESVGSDVSDVLQRAAYIDRFMLRNRMSRQAETQWTSLRADLNTLATYYNVSWNWNQTLPPFTAGNTTTPVYTVSDGELKTLFTRIETKTDAFKRQLNSSLDRSAWNNTDREDNIQAFVTEFENSTDRLKQRFDARESVGSDVSDVLQRAAYIDQFMSRNRLSRQAETQWTSLRSDLNSLATYYNVSWNWNQTLPPFTPGNYNNTGTTGNNTGRRFDSRLTGTYRLNTALSDNVSSVIDRSVGVYATNQRDNMKRNLERRLRSPETIAIEKTGDSVTLASGNAPRVTFEVDGRARTETNNRGRTITTTATADRQEGFSINYEGERSNDFYVSFLPTRDRQLKVMRRIYLENRNDQITVTSVYDKTDEVAQWPNVNNEPYQTGTNGRFYIVNGTQLTATLNDPIKTGTSQVNDRFTMEVTSPSQYRGAIIEGHVTEADKSGRVSGRANISLDFDTIRMPNGQTYQFAGIIDGATAANGDDIKVNNEGTVRDSSQTTKTVTRAGIGAALGAIIGAIAGGGSGAAIGAAVGAGAGAGTVLIQGRDGIDLGEGSTFRITATGPNGSQTGRQ